MRRKNKNSWHGGIYLLTAAGMYSLFSVFARIIGFELPLVYQQGVRTAFSALLVFFILVAKKKLLIIDKMRDWWWLFVRALVGLISFLSFFVAANNLTIGTNYFLSYFGMTVGGYSVGKLVFGEKMSFSKWGSLFLALLGLFLIYFFDLKFIKPIYLILALNSGIFGSLWNSLVKKISEKYSALQLSMMDSFFAAIISFLVSKAIGEVWVVPTISRVWTASLLFSVLYIGTDLFIVWGFRLVEVHLGSLLMLSEVLFAILLGFLIYHESISVFSLLGGALIVLGIALPEILTKKRPG